MLMLQTKKNRDLPGKRLIIQAVSPASLPPAIACPTFPTEGKTDQPLVAPTVVVAEASQIFTVNGISKNLCATGN